MDITQTTQQEWLEAFARNVKHGAEVHSFDTPDAQHVYRVDGRDFIAPNLPYVHTVSQAVLDSMRLNPLDEIALKCIQTIQPDSLPIQVDKSLFSFGLPEVRVENGEVTVYFRISLVMLKKTE